MDKEQKQDMQNTKRTKTNNELGFLYKKLKGIVSRYTLSYWLTVPEFYDEMIRLKGTNATIDANVIFQTMQEIYKEKQEDRDEGREVDFMFQPARNAIKALALKVTGSKDNWDNW